jgi:hypothetical protein
MRRLLVLAAATAAVAGACDTTTPRVPSAVEVEPDSLTVGVGQTATAEAVVVDQDGRAYTSPPEGFTIAWSSSNESVAIVQNGVIEGIAGGFVTITARAGDLPPADILVHVEGSLHVTGGAFDLPIIESDDEASRVVSAEMGFSYSGHVEGTFALNETFALRDVSPEGSYAWTFYNTEYNDQDFVAWQYRQDGLLDYTEFYVDGGVTAPGTYEVYLAFFMRGLDVVANTVQTYYRLDSLRGDAPGTLTVTQVDGQLVGTFSMDLEVASLTNLMADPHGANRAWTGATLPVWLPSVPRSRR